MDHERGEEREKESDPEGDRHPEGEARPDRPGSGIRKVPGNGGAEEDDVNDPDPAVPQGLVLHEATAFPSARCANGPSKS